MLRVVDSGEYCIAIGWPGPERRGSAVGNVIYLPTRRRADLNRNRAAERELAELRAARDFIATLVADNPLLDPIFDRLETEIAIEQAKLATDDPVTRARAIVAARHSQ